MSTLRPLTSAERSAISEVKGQLGSWFDGAEDEDEDGAELPTKKKRHEGGGGGRRVVGMGVRLEQREGAVMVRGVSSLDGLLVLRRTTCR